MAPIMCSKFTLARIKKICCSRENFFARLNRLAILFYKGTIECLLKFCPMNVPCTGKCFYDRLHSMLRTATAHVLCSKKSTFFLKISYILLCVFSSPHNRVTRNIHDRRKPFRKCHLLSTAACKAGLKPD